MLDDQSTLIRSLSRTLQHHNVPPRLFETHISWVLVTENVAYKIKKAVRFEFLDFSTMHLRRFYCQEELRLNSRLSPELYLDVVAIGGTSDAPAIGAPGVAIEYALKMRAFPQESIWNARLRSGCLLPLEVDALARQLAHFHQCAAVATTNSMWGSSETVGRSTSENLASIVALLVGRHQENWAEDMRTWQRDRQEELADTFDNRKQGGWIRECHGDLHCGNILTINDQVRVFDCIEFNESMRWIDVMDDIAFVCMDLRFQQRADLAARLLNQYLEIVGDYDGLLVFRYYQLERALVRCKVALLRAQQLHFQAQSAAPHSELAARYMAFAAELVQPPLLVFVIMHGYSGSGKSTIAKCLVEAIGAIQIRSDVERKRMHGLPMAADHAVAPAAGLYDVAATDLTYARLRILARQVIRSGFSVIVDAAFLRQDQRRRFRNLARELGIPFFILDVQTGEATMRERIVARAQLGRDPSDAGLPILAHQFVSHERLSDEEFGHVIRVSGETILSAEALRGIVAPIMTALASGDWHGAPH